MKSRITIEVDFDNGNSPVIQILKQKSDDVRDGLISHFTQQLGGSSWCQIQWVGHSFDSENIDINRIHISPITRADLFKHACVMLKNHYINLESNVPGIPVFPEGSEDWRLYSELKKVFGCEAKVK